MNPTTTRASPARSPVIADQTMISTTAISNQFKVVIEFWLRSPGRTNQRSASKPPICLLILFARFGDDFRRKRGRRGALIPCKRLEVVAYVLFIEGELRPAGIVRIHRPVSRRVRRERLVCQRQPAFDEPEFQLCIRQDDAALQRIRRRTPINLQRQVSELAC